MNISDAPKKQPVPFGVNGKREDLLSTTPEGDNQASYDAGFPPITMILKSAGGLPPKGQDMNQILYELAAIARWAGAGANYPFDSTFATAIGGYPAGAKVLASDNAGFWLNETDANSTNPEASDYTLTGWVPVEHTGITAITGLGASDVTLSSLQAAKDTITLAGALTSNINLILPAWVKQWKVINNCTGAFTVTVKTNSGTGQPITSGQQINVRGDGVNIYSSELNAENNLSDLASIPTALANLGLGDGSTLPVGTPIPWPTSTAPTGWLKCNGATFTAAQYPKLALAYPGLVLPDLRGEFIRGWDDGRGVDSGRTLLSAQSDAIRNITGVLSGGTNTVGESMIFRNASGVFSLSGDAGTFASHVTGLANDRYPTATFNASNVVPTAAENRPVNIAFNYIVRAA